MATIPSALRDAAARYGAAPAVVDGDYRLTFSDLLTEAQAVASALVAAGIAPGDRVALWAPNSGRWMVASMGVYLAGALLVPVNTRNRAVETEHILRKSRARMVITVSDFAGHDFLAALSELDEVAGRQTVVMSGSPTAGVTGWREFLARGTPLLEAELGAREAGIGDDTPSDIIFTSGTTGAPKGVVLTHGASVRTYQIWADLVGLQMGDRYLVVYPFFHTAGLKSGILACVVSGATVYPHAVFDVPSVMEVVSAERITVLPGTPTVFQSILHHPDFESFDLSSLRLSVTGAAVVPVSIVKSMRDQLGFHTVVTGYGMTETTGTISMCRHDDPPEVVAETVGRPLPGVEVRVVDDDGLDVTPGQPGEFWVRGFNVMKGYFDDLAATAESLTPEGWLKTGDVGFVDGAGNLRITDRKKDMFIVGGFNAYPAEIEACLLGHPGIAQVAVVGMPDDRLGEVGAAFVVPVAGAQLDTEEVLSWARQRLANFKVPRRVVVRGDLPLTPSGKVMKFALQRTLA